MTEINHRNKLIVKSNTLIESKYHLSVREQKFLIYLASLVKKDDLEYQYTTVKIKDIERALKVSDDKKWGSVYEVIREIAENINKKPIYIRSDNGSWELIYWFSKITANTVSGEVKFELTNDIKNKLVQLKELFTQYRFGNILSLKSSYSIRIYELLKLNQFKGKIRYELDFFRELIGVSYLDDKKNWVHKYQEYKAFKRSILKHAQKELKRETDIYFELKEEREGRSVKYLTFYVFKNQPKKKTSQSELFVDPTPVEEVSDVFDYNSNVVVGLVKFGLSEEKAQELYRNGFNTIENPEVRKQIVSDGRSLDEYLLEKIDYVNFQMTKGEVNNPAGLLIKSIKENYYSKELQKQQKARQRDKKRRENASIERKLDEQIRGLKQNIFQLKNNGIQLLLEKDKDLIKNITADTDIQYGAYYDHSKTPEENYRSKKSTVFNLWVEGLIVEKHPAEFTEMLKLKNDLQKLEKEMSSL